MKLMIFIIYIHPSVSSRRWKIVNTVHVIHVIFIGKQMSTEERLSEMISAALHE